MLAAAKFLVACEFVASSSLEAQAGFWFKATAISSRLSLEDLFEQNRSPDMRPATWLAIGCLDMRSILLTNGMVEETDY